MAQRRSALLVVAVAVAALALGTGATAVVRGDLVSVAWWRAARFASDHDLHGPARFLFMQFALRHPDHELAVPAVNLMLDDYNLTGDWAGLVESQRRVQADPRLGLRLREAEKAQLR